jgi:hypothetical protein
MIDFGKKDRKNMPIASVYVELDQKLVVRTPATPNNHFSRRAISSGWRSMLWLSRPGWPE